MEIRQVKENEYSEIMEVAWRVFLKYNAPAYSMEGVLNFRKFLTDETVYKLFLAGEYRIFGFFDDDNMPKGLISLRNRNHISLLFVEDEYRNKGIGVRLLNYLCSYCWDYEGERLITVNSSPYARGFYRKYGFVETAGEQFSDGIYFTPMEYALN